MLNIKTLCSATIATIFLATTTNSSPLTAREKAERDCNISADVAMELSLQVRTLGSHDFADYLSEANKKAFFTCNNRNLTTRQIEATNKGIIEANDVLINLIDSVMAE